MSINVRIEGGEKIIENLHKVNAYLLADLRRTVEREALRIEGYAKEYAPVDTGRLRSSIHSQRALGDPMTWYVGDGVHYGIYVEFGTSKMYAQPFLVPAVYQSLPIYEAELQTILARIPKV